MLIYLFALAQLQRKKVTAGVATGTFDVIAEK
jgi:hypothetical protein